MNLDAAEREASFKYGDSFAVVTGATGGLGREICRAAAIAGYVVVAHYHSNSVGADELVRQIQAIGGRAHCVQADLGTVEGIDALCVFTSDLLDQSLEASVGLLVNNAAILLGPSFGSANPAEFDRYMAVNTRAPFFLSQRLLSVMTPGSSIVNISSANVHFSSPGDIVYSMSKAALESFTRHVAEAAASCGVRVNTVVPGFTDNGHPAFADPTVRKYMSSFAVLGDVSAPKHVAEAVMFLASDAASRSTGITLDVSGGSLLAARGHPERSVKDLVDPGRPATAARTGKRQ